MQIITPERIATQVRAAVTTDQEVAITNPVGVGQVLIINGVELSAYVAEAAGGAGAIAEGTLALALTTDVAAADVVPQGATAVDTQDGDNLCAAIGSYTVRQGFGTDVGYAVFEVPTIMLWDFRGLEFRRRPMTNVDLRAVLNITTGSLDMDFIWRFFYQVAELEPGDLGLGSVLPVGARVVRGPQVPDGGAWPAGRIK